MTKLRVLLIDDEEDFLDVMSVRIRSWGYEVITADSAKEAMAVIKIGSLDEKPDVVILDYLMPEVDGVKLLKQIRAFDKDIPAIMFTAYPDARAIAGTQKLRVFAFIPKFGVYCDAGVMLRTALRMVEKNIRKQKQERP